MSKIEFVSEYMRNDALIAKLQAMDSDAHTDLPEWKRLIQLGGLFSEAIRTLGAIGSREKTKLDCDEIAYVIAGAVEYHILAPMKDELDAAWRDWECNETGKYTSVTNRDEMFDLIMRRIEQEYPGFADWIVKCFPQEAENLQR